MPHGFTKTHSYKTAAGKFIPVMKINSPVDCTGRVDVVTRTGDIWHARPSQILTDEEVKAAKAAAKVAAK